MKAVFLAVIGLWTVVNEDSNTTIHSLPEDKLTREALRDHFVRHVAGRHLTHYFVNPQCMSCMYDSKVGEPTWVEHPGLEPAPSWVKKMKAFHDKGIDPYAVYVGCAREAGVSPWISMRMNDVHGLDKPRNGLTTQMWLDHPEWRRGKPPHHSWNTGAFNYAVPEVSAHFLALARELLERYDVDGIECDWLRFAHHLPIGHEREYAHVLTDFMGKVRALADEIGAKRGRRLGVAVRVSASPENALGLGTDAVEWARRGYVDVVTGGNHWLTVDFEAAWDDWKRLLAAANPKVKMLASVDDGVLRDGQRRFMTVDEVAGYFDVAQSKGVTDGAVIFNWFVNFPGHAICKLAVDEGLTPETLAKHVRTYVVTQRDAPADDMADRAQLPVDLAKRREITVTVGRPRPGDQVSVRLYRRKDDAVPLPLAGVTLNGFRPLSVSDDVCTFPFEAVKGGANVVAVGPAEKVGVAGVTLTLTPMVTNLADGRLAGPSDRAVLVRVPKDETEQPKELPVGEALPALPPDPFPDRLSAFVWRNWGIVDKTRLAETVGATVSELTQVATEMGLAADPVVEPEWTTRGYITVIRRNWHLLDYNQLLKLTGMSVAQMKSVLLDHDFLFQKLGRMKPLCHPLVYRAEEVALTHGARRKIAETLAAEGIDASAPQEPRFSFVRELTAPRQAAASNQQPTTNNQSLRLMSSYFADFGDPLGDDDVGSYPEGLLDCLAAEGVNAVWLPVAFKYMDARHYANGRKLTARAAKRGMGVYVYLNEPRGDGQGMCTSLPETRRHLVEKTRELFAAVPDLRGAFTITASENPTSCVSQGGKAACPRCKDRAFAEIVTEVNSCIAEGMHAANPKAELIVWDWGWDSCSGEDWRTLVPAVLAKLPKENVRFLTISERFIPTNRGGFPAKVNEYSISTPGPGERALTCWTAAKANGLGAMAKVQASASWEFASVPYLPCLDLVAEHAWNLKRADIDDVMLSWSVGAWPSPNLRLFGLVRKDDLSPDAALDRLAAELYGKEHVMTARAAWKAYSDGFREYPFWSCVLHRGPHHMGPANPLYPVATGYRTTMTGIPYDDLPGWSDIYPEETWISQMAKVRDGFAAGNRLWAEHLKPLKGEARTFALREARMFEAIELHFRSVVDQAEFIRARRRGDKAEMRRLAACELETAKTMLKAVRYDARIGYECANHYFYTQQDILEKIVNCRNLYRY